jgi:hypothetical protein
LLDLCSAAEKESAASRANEGSGGGTKRVWEEEDKEEKGELKRAKSLGAERGHETE